MADFDSKHLSILKIFPSDLHLWKPERFYGLRLDYIFVPISIKQKFIDVALNSLIPVLKDCGKILYIYDE
jgi:hypothetical protein